MEIVFGVEDIMKILPHRYPFLLIDAVTKLEKYKEVEGYKNFTMNEWFFQGEQSSTPVVPPIFIVESLAQLSAMMFYNDEQQSVQSEEQKTANEPQMGYLGKIKDMQFKKPIVPGERIKLVAYADETIGKVCQVKASAYSENGDCVAEGFIMITY